MSTIELMSGDEKRERVEAEIASGSCGCGGACAACRAHAEWMAGLEDEERSEFADLVASGIYAP